MERFYLQLMQKKCLLLANKFLINAKIGNGAFSDVLFGRNLDTGEEVAVKIESADAERQLLISEIKVYTELKDGIPRLIWGGKQLGLNIMVLELLGPNLEDLLNYCDRRFSLKTVLLLADKMITLLENVHARGFIHRDIKPDNFAMGIGLHFYQPFLIDFGFAQRYCAEYTKEHVPFADKCNLTGTLNYATVNVHRGIKASRRDDMEGLGYVFIYLLRGSLPWHNIRSNSKNQHYERVYEMKVGTTTDQLCQGLPIEFSNYLLMCRSMRFADEPNYFKMRQMFQQLFSRKNYTMSNLYDWEIKNKLLR